MPATRLSRRLAPRSVNKDLFELLEKSLLAELSTLFLVSRGGIEIRFTVKSQDSSERSDSVFSYRPKVLPDLVESASLLLHYVPIGLIAFVEISPLRQGVIILACGDDDESVSTKLIGLLHFMEELTGEKAHARTLPQPNTLYRVSRIPSCKLTRQKIKELHNCIDDVMDKFLGQQRSAKPDVNITFHTSGGKAEVKSFEHLPPLSEVVALEIEIRHIERERTSSVTMELAPTSRINTLEIRLSAFDTPIALKSADSVTAGILSAIAEHRTLNGLLYWPQPFGILTWFTLLLFAMIMIDHGVSAVALLITLLLPAFVVAARRQYPYISFEPKRRSLLDQALMMLASLTATVLLLPWFVSWLARLLG